jgi:hypothetical protein
MHYLCTHIVQHSFTDLSPPTVGATNMACGECIQVDVVAHELRQVRFGVHVLHPLLEREVIDSPSFRGSVGQVPSGVADSALCAVCVHEFSALHFGVGGVPVGHAHVHTNWDGFQSLQPMSFEDCSDFMELAHFAARGEQGACELPNISSGLYACLVGCLPVQDGE